MNGAAWGGSEELWYTTALYLAGRGVTVGCAAYAWPEKEERLQKLEGAGCAVYRLPQRDKSGNVATRLVKKIRHQKKMRRAVDALPLPQYGMVLVNQGGFEVCATQWKNFYKRLHRYALVFHNYSEGHVFSARQKGILKAWLQNAATNLFAANPIKEMLQRQLNTEIKNAAVFVNPITFTPPLQAGAFPPLVDGGYIFSVVAALDVERKAQDKLIRILSTEKWKARRWQLRLYGEGKDRTLLQTLIDENGLAQSVFLKGHTAAVAEALRQSHLVLQLTAVDAMPLSVMEAMAVGRPLAVTRIGDMPAWVREGDNGWVCSVDEEAIDACLEKAWQHRHEWEAMGRRSFRLFKQKFPARVEEDFLRLLQAKAE